LSHPGNSEVFLLKKKCKKVKIIKLPPAEPRDFMGITGHLGVDLQETEFTKVSTRVLCSGWGPRYALFGSYDFFFMEEVVDLHFVGSRSELAPAGAVIRFASLLVRVSLTCQ
jgi:hypothetical protein